MYEHFSRYLTVFGTQGTYAPKYRSQKRFACVCQASNRWVSTQKTSEVSSYRTLDRVEMLDIWDKCDRTYL